LDQLGFARLSARFGKVFSAYQHVNKRALAYIASSYKCKFRKAGFRALGVGGTAFYESGVK